MKKSILTTLLVVSIICANAQTTYPTGTTGCIGRWTFNSNDGNGLNPLLDESNNGNDGTNNNITASAGWRNMPNTAGNFNGVNSWSQVTDKAILRTTEFTVISLVKINGFNSATCQSNQILSKGYPNFIAGNYGMSFGDNIFDGSCTIVSPTKNQLTGQIGIPNTTAYYTAGNYLNTSKWYFFAFSMSNNQMKNYQIAMDSSTKSSTLLPFNTQSVANNVGVNTQNISIGKHLNPVYPYWFSGDMDELILFNKALTDTEVYDVYSYLFGAPLTSIFYSIKDKFSTTIVNSNVTIITNEKKYNLEIFNLLGQKINTFNNIYGNFTTHISNENKQFVIIKIIAENGECLSMKGVN